MTRTDIQTGASSLSVIADFRHRLHVVLAGRSFLGLIAAWFFVWGVGALILRATRLVEEPSPVTMVLGIPLMMILAWARARGRVPDDESLIALFDRANDCGGLLMAANVAGADSWAREIPSLAPPDLRWRVPPRRLALVILGGCFAAAVLVIPMRFIVPPGPGVLKVDDEVNALKTELETLANEEIIPASMAEKLQERLDSLKSAGTGDDPARTWEALDHLEQAAARAAKEGLEKAVAETERMARAQQEIEDALRSGLPESVELPDLDWDKMNAKGTESARLPTGHGGGPKPDPGEKKPPTRQDLASASQRLSSKMNSMMSKFNRMGTGRKLDPKLLSRLQGLKPLMVVDPSMFASGTFELGSGPFTIATSGRFVPASPGDKPGSNTVLVPVAVPVDGGEGQPGNGGIDRGRGDAAMRYADSTSPEGAKFQEQVLSPNEASRWAESQVIGEAMTAPQADPQAGPSTGGALQAGQARNAPATTRVILPRHRATVKRFFRRD